MDTENKEEHSLSLPKAENEKVKEKGSLLSFHKKQSKKRKTTKIRAIWKKQSGNCTQRSPWVNL